MQLIVDHKPVAIKEDMLIDYVASNVLFAKREDFSLAFEVSLRDRNNREIFSNVFRKDVDIATLYYDAEIYAGTFHSSGAVAVVEVGDETIKLQYLQGRSFTNFYPDFDNVYVDELDLGSYDGSITNRRPMSFWGDTDVIALPWVNNASGNMQNRVDYDFDNSVWGWHTVKDDDDDTEVVYGASCQIRLYALVEKILDALGYTFNASEWQNNYEYYHLYMLNTLPYAWGDHAWSSALPHWSINEFFDELEKFILGEFVFDHKLKTCDFHFHSAIETAAGTVKLDDIVDEFSVQVDKDDKSDYNASGNTGYTSCNHELWNFYSCYWLFHENPNMKVKRFSTLVDLVNYGIQFGRGTVGDPRCHWLLYAEDVDTYFVYYEVMKAPINEQQQSMILYGSFYELRPVNRFGDWIADDEKYKEKEDLKFVPAWLDLAIDADYVCEGRILFLDCGSTDNTSTSGSSGHIPSPGHRPVPVSTDDANQARSEVDQANLFATQRILSGSRESKGATFDKIYLGFWYGEYGVFGSKLPAPWVDRFEITVVYGYVDHGDGTHSITHAFSSISSGHQGTMRINNPNYSFAVGRDAMIKIDGKKEYQFSFLADNVPNPRAIYNIRNKLYLCSRIECQIDRDGLNCLMKGIFYRITDIPE